MDNENINFKFVLFCGKMVCFCVLVVLVFGVIGLFGWLLEIVVLMSVLFGLVIMKVNMVLGFLLIGLFFFIVGWEKFGLGWRIV